MWYIKINGSADQLTKFGAFFKEYFKTHQKMNINFQIPSNHNSGNNVKANSTLGQ